jgi:hypothetical protein
MEPESFSLGMGKERDAFLCGEYERAAYALSEVSTLLETINSSKTSSLSAGIFVENIGRKLLQKINYIVTKGSTFTNNAFHHLGSSNSYHSSLMKSLEFRNVKLTDQLILLLKQRLMAIFHDAMHKPKSSALETNHSSQTGIVTMSMTSQGLEEESSQFPSRIFAHCVRALVVLGHGKFCETALIESVTLKLAKSSLTQGKSIKS